MDLLVRIIQWFGFNLSAILSCTVVLLVAYCLAIHIANRWKLPPGPSGFPIIGCFPLADDNVPELFKKWSDKHGEIFSFQLGQRLTVVLSSWDLIKEAYVKKNDVFAGRPRYSTLGHLYENNSTATADGELFDLQKRFLLTSLRNSGFAKLSVEQKIQEEAEAMMSIFRENKNRPMDVSEPFYVMTTNIICSIAFGKRFEYSDPRINQLIHYLSELLIIIDQVSLSEAFPIMRFLPDKLNNLHKLRKIKKSLEDFIDEIIDEHIQTYDANHPRDLVDQYLKKMEENGISFKDTNGRKVFSRHNVIQNLILIFFAGTETTSTILAWAIKLLLNNPEVQAKIQNEIDREIGRSRPPSWMDRSKLPFTEATISEIHRVASIVPLNVAHANMEEVCLKGYKIPKRSCIITNLWQVHHDPKLWSNPEKFDPTRFLDRDGKATKPEYLIPFSVGKRLCLGESLAKMELFIFFVSFLQNFRFRCVDGEVPDCTKVIHGLVRKTAPFQVLIEPR